MTAPELPPNASVAGKYTVISRLGAGGSSSTYHAVTADGREVALKLFDPAIRQRADIMSALEQTYAATNALPPDIVVPLLDAGYDPATGAPFSVTERIPFPSLAQLLTQRPLMPDELAAILGYLARALDTAHSRQLCHHAIKPTNIFVGFAQGYGVRVTDFGAGLARAAVPTHQGYTLAAPWLAPEQVQGTVPPGPAADVFATALVIFFALTGRPYWRSFQGAPDLALWQQELLGPRVAPSVRAQELGVSLSAAFDGLLGVSIAPDPTQRYRSVGELFAAYEGVLKGPMLASATTMAFPALSVDGPGDYPPPPKPLGGLGMPQGPGVSPAEAAVPAVAPFESALAPSPTGAPAPGHGASGYGASGPPGDVTRPGNETIENRRPGVNKLVPIVVGAAAVLLLGGGITAALMMSRKSPTGGEAGASSATAAANASAAKVAEAPTAAASPPAPAETAAPTETAAPSESAAPTASASAGAPVAPTLTVSCDPECDEIKVDGKVVEADKPLALPLGKHLIVGAKAGYNSAPETVTLLDKPIEKKIRLAAIKVASPGPAPGPSPTPAPAGGGSKPKCGKFIKTNCVK